MDQPADFDVRIADHEGYPKATAKPNRLVYATMTGTDIALYRLDKTYVQLDAEGAKVFQLTDTPPSAGDQVDVLVPSHRVDCTVEAVVPHLREEGYELDNSLRYAVSDDCGLGAGYSGSALVAPDGDTVVGIHNTTNRDGEKCTKDNPCEVAEDGTVTAEQGRSYAQQVSVMAGGHRTGSTSAWPRRT